MPIKSLFDDDVMKDEIFNKRAEQLSIHDFAALTFRKYKMKITLSSDNPNIGGIPLKETIIVLAGLNDKHNIPENKTIVKALKSRPVSSAPSNTIIF